MALFFESAVQYGHTMMQSSTLCKLNEIVIYIYVCMCVCVCVFCMHVTPEYAAEVSGKRDSQL